MQKVDMVIAGVGVVALLATTLGVVFYEEAAGEQEIRFPEAPYGISDSANGVGAGTQTFEFDLRDNATALQNLAVAIAFTGTATPGASGGSYEVRVSTPNGTCTQAGAWSSASRTINVPSCRWMAAPAITQSTDYRSLDMGTTWATPLKVEVVITNPAAPVVGNPPAGTSYTYDIDVSGQILTYAATVATPEVQTA